MVSTHEEYIKLLESELKTHKFVPLNESEISAFIRKHQLDQYLGIVTRDVQTDVKILINLHNQGKTAYRSTNDMAENKGSESTSVQNQKNKLAKNQVVGITGQIYSLEEKTFSSGGEGDIYRIVGDGTHVIKIYHTERVSEDLERKLMYMAKNPPSSSVLDQVAWPLDVIYDGEMHFKGFVMPKLAITAELGDVYGYPPSSPESKIPYKHKLILAMNICTVINAVHGAGYIFGDFNPRNIGINLNTGRVAFLDTDSYHIVIDEKTNIAFRCKVCLNGYVAPELLERCKAYNRDAYANAPLPTFTKETDNFALAIHIFKLLMNGYTPFNGIKDTERVSTACPGNGNEAIKRDAYCFKPGNKPLAVAVPPASILPDKVRQLFNRAFIEGKNNPQKRPTAKEWYSALAEYEKVLAICPKHPTQHMYKKGLLSCPWCDADERYAQSINPPLIQRTFPSPVSPMTPPVHTSIGATTVTSPVASTYLAVRGTSAASAHVQKSSQIAGLSSKTKKRITMIISASIAVFVAVLVIESVISSKQKRQSLYEEAVGFIEQENYDRAISTLNELGDYKDSAELLEEAKEIKTEQDYIAAMNFLISGDYDDALTAFSALGNYKDSEKRYEEVEGLRCSSIYADAAEYFQSGNLYEAAINFYSLDDFEDARERCFACWSMLTERNTISAGGLHSKGFTLGVKSNGTVVTTGNNQYGQCDVGSWTDIVAVAAGMYHSVGLRSDGTVVAVGGNDDGQCDVSGWTDIVAISAYYHTVGLKADGTVVATGDNSDGECDVSEWTDIVEIAAGSGRTVGLKADGTVLTVGGNAFGSAEVSDWSNMATIASDMGCTIGVRNDGIAVGVGDNSVGSLNFDGWKDMIDIAHGCLCTIGVRRDGTTVGAGSGARIYTGWTNIIMVDGRSYHIVGLRGDGTVVADGNNESGQCNVDGWTDIKIPN